MLTERDCGAVARVALLSPTPAATTPRDPCWRSQPLIEAGLLLPATDVIVDANPALGRREDAVRATHFSRSPASWRPTVFHHHRHGAEIEQGRYGRSTFNSAPAADRNRGNPRLPSTTGRPGTTESDPRRSSRRSYKCATMRAPSSARVGLFFPPSPRSSTGATPTSATRLSVDSVGPRDPSLG